MPKKRRYMATYDLTPSGHAEFKNNAALEGWQAWNAGKDGVRWQLPNTFLLGRFESREDALHAFREAARKTKRELPPSIAREFRVPKVMIAPCPQGVFISDELWESRSQQLVRSLFEADHS